MKDQQETVHAFDFDALGRQTQDRVTALGSGVDDTVRRIATTYDILGRREKITSYDNPTVGSGSIANEVQFAYDDFGQLVTEYQEHGGAVNTSTSLKVQYAYEDGTDNNVRLTKMTYPDGRELNYSYGSSGSTDDALSRVASLIDNDGSTHLVDYSYLGGGSFVKADYPEPDLRYDLAMGTGSDPYDGFDRFGRVVDSRWYDYGSSADADRIKYGYDRASNRTYREQTCDTNSFHDEVYSYDDINRLTDFDRGTINANKDAISTLKFAQRWSLDPTGNWSGFKEDDDGDSTWNLDQSRMSNKVNEITDITETSGSSWVTPAYNRAGDMTIIPKPADPTNSFAATYDAWNRLVKLEEGVNTLAEYIYDGAKRRVVEKTYSGGSLDETRHSYYTDPQKWQVIEERLETGGSISSNPDRQFVWGPRYIDDFVLRDRDTDSNGTLDERLYALQDANWNVTVLANASGNVQERYAYSAYGTPRVLTAAFATRASSSYDAEVLYAGYRYEHATALYHIRHREYQPEMGCWLQRDPIGYAGDHPDVYRYVENAPVNRVDPSGRLSIKVSAPEYIKCGAAKPWVAEFVLDSGEEMGFIIQKVRTKWWYRTCDDRLPKQVYQASAKCGQWTTNDPGQFAELVYWEMWAVKDGNGYAGVFPHYQTIPLKDTFQPRYEVLQNEFRQRDVAASAGEYYQAGEIAFVKGDPFNQSDFNQTGNWQVSNRPPTGPLAYSCEAPKGWGEASIAASRSWQFAWFCYKNILAIEPRAGALPEWRTGMPEAGAWWKASGVHEG